MGAAQQNFDLSSGVVDSAPGGNFDLSAGVVEPSVKTSNTVSAAKPGILDTIESDLKNAFTSIPTVPSPYPGMDEDTKAKIADQSEANDVRRKAAGYGPVYRAVAPVAEAAGTNVTGMEQAAAEGNPRAVLGHAIAGAGMAAAPLAAEGAAHAAAAPAALLDTTRSVRAAMPEETAGLPKVALQGAEDVYRAAAPVGTNTRFRANVYAAAGDLAEVGRDAETRLKASKGGVIQPDMRTRVTVDAINNHLSEMYQQERAPQIANHPDAPVPLDLSEDGQAGLNAMSRSGEANVRAIARRATSGTLSLAEADELARATNSELQKYESMDPAQQAAARVTSKSIAGLKELDRALSDGIDDQLQIDGQPGIKSYERRYAALSAIRNQLERRVQAAELNQGIKNSAPFRAVRDIHSAVTGGPAGIASASQAAVADVPQGSMLERGLGRLAKSGIKANRAVPRPAAPLELTPPPGRVPPAAQQDLNFNGADKEPPQPKQLPAGRPFDMPPSSAPEQKLLTSGERRVTPRNGHAFTEAERQKFLQEQRRVEAARHPNPHLAENPFDRHPSHSEVLRHDEALDVLSGRKKRAAGFD